MTTIRPCAPAQPRPDSSNPYLVAMLTVTLGEGGWTVPRFLSAFRVRDPQWIAGITKLAHEMGLVAPVQPKVKEPAKQKLSQHDEEPLILPVPLRPQPPKSANIIKLSDRRGPAPWMVEGDGDEQH